MLKSWLQQLFCFNYFKFLFCVYDCLAWCVPSVCTSCGLVLVEARRGCKIPWNWSCEWPCCVLGIGLGLLQGQTELFKPGAISPAPSSIIYEGCMQACRISSEGKCYLYYSGKQTDLFFVLKGDPASSKDLCHTDVLRKIVRNKPDASVCVLTRQIDSRETRAQLSSTA